MSKSKVSTNDIKQKYYYEKLLFYENFEFVNKCIFKGTSYKVGFFLNELSSENELELFEIVDFILNKEETEVFIVVQYYERSKYDTNILAYIVGERLEKYAIKNISDFSLPFHLHILPNDKVVFKPKLFFPLNTSNRYMIK